MLGQVAWDFWTKLPEVEREPYIKAVIDRMPLIGLVGLPTGKAMAKAKTAPLTTPTKRRMSQRDLASVGSCFLDAVKDITPTKGLPTTKNNRFLKKLTARSCSGLKMPKCQKIIKSLWGGKLRQHAVRRLADGLAVKRKFAGKQTRVSNTDLKAMLAPFMTEHSRDEKIGRLAVPLRVCYEQSPKLRSAMSFSRLRTRLRLRMPRCGVGRSTKSVDVCPYCSCFDREVAPPLAASARSALETIGTMVPGYYNPWHAECLRRGWLCSAHGLATNYDALSLFVEMLAGSATGIALEERKEWCSKASEVEKTALGTLEKNMVVVLRQHMPDLLCFSTHWKLRDWLLQWGRDVVRKPEPGTLYIWSDWKDTMKACV